MPFILSIETGMQNSALAVVLAKHMPNPVLTSLPGALSATCHSLIGYVHVDMFHVHFLLPL
jgi:predicted Na+-dependent transporter